MTGPQQRIFRAFYVACADVRTDPEAGWAAVVDEDWTPRAFAHLTRRAIEVLPELVFGTLNATFRACPSTSSGRVLVRFYHMALRDTTLSDRARRAALEAAREFMRTPRAWVGARERRVAMRCGFGVPPTDFTLEKRTPAWLVPGHVRVIWEKT